MKKILLLPILMVIFKMASFAQIPDYRILMLDTNLNFNSIRFITQHYFDSTGLDTIPKSGYTAFKRWEEFWRPRVGNSQNLGSFQPALEAMTELLVTPTICNGGTYDKQWEFIGHSTTEPDNPSNGSIDNGRGQGVLNKVYVDLVNDPTGNTVYVGTRSSELWRTRNANCTTENCQTWVCLTEIRFPAMGVNDIIVDPENANNIYISTSFGNLDDFSYGMGLLKTTNGQSNNPTWEPTGLTYDLSAPSNLIYTQGIFISPDDNDVLFAFMHTKLFKSIDAGETFTEVFTLPNSRAYYKDLVFLPSQSSTIFVSTIDQANGALVLISTDNGDTWTDITSDLGMGSKRQIDIASTSANTSMIVAGGGTSSNYEISISTNSGVNWTNYSTTFDSDGYLGWPENDICISPTNVDRIYVCGSVLHKLSTINNTTHAMTFDELYDYNANIVHPDVRDLFVMDDGSGNDILYSANDGGLDISLNSGSTWNKANGTGLCITQIYGFDFNSNKNWISIGCQDLGWYNYDGTSWKVYTGGDGYNMLFNPFASIETMYGQNNNFLNISTDKGISWSIVPDTYTDDRDRLRKMIFDSKGNQYFGYFSKLYRRLASETTFELFKEFPNTVDQIKGIGICKSNPNVIYIAFGQRTQNGDNATNKLFKTVNALEEDLNDVVWEDISKWVPCNWSGITDIVVDPYNADKFWISTGTGFVNGSAPNEDRIWYSSSGGNDYDHSPTFVAIGTNLNINENLKVRFPVNVMALDEATGGMYIGTDIGVFYNPNPKSTTSPWTCFNKGLPTVVVNDLKIDYCQRKILAGTFGRGLWECDLAEIPNRDNELSSSNTPELISVSSGQTRLFYSDITIPNGQTLVINGTIKMGPDRKITVKPGGKILLDGGKITSTCDKPWAGIRVEGASNLQQTIVNQGFVEIINSGTIENAQNGVSLSGLNSNGRIDWGKTGGIIQAANAYFYNNKRDVEFLSYHNRNQAGKEIPNISFFKNCTFQTNDNNKFEPNQLTNHITMYDINGVGIYGCDFEDARTGIDPKESRTGLYTIDAGYTVTNYCATFTIPPCATDHTRFLNLRNCIQSFSNKNGTITIQNTDFNSYKGVYLYNVTNALVRSNLFYIKHEALLSGSTDYPYGLYLDKCDKFNTEGNQFTGMASGSIDASDGGAAGIVVKNSGENNNEIYRSNFDDLRIGCQAINYNKGAGIPFGLRFYCNDYENGFNDIDISQLPSSPFTSGIGIAEKQGLVLNNFGNTSSIINLNIQNNCNFTSVRLRLCSVL